MSETLQTLHAEHRTTARMLELLERQINLFEQAERPDYDLLKEVIDYLVTYPNLYHHPKEDLILRTLRERAPEAAAPVGDLDKEHALISSRLQDFANAVVNVLMEAEVSREAFLKIAREFIHDQRRHMVKEEQVFFPAAKSALTAEDWKVIDNKVASFEDPLASSDKDPRFASLRDQLFAGTVKNG